MGADHYNMNTPDDSTGKITGYQLSEQDYDVYCSVGTTERQMLAGFHGGSYSAFGTSESVTANFKFYLFNGMLAEKAGSCPLSSNTYGHYEIDLGVAVWDNTAMAGLQTNSALGNSDNTNKYTCGGLTVGYSGVLAEATYGGVSTYSVTVTISGYSVGDTLIPRATATMLTGASLDMSSDYEAYGCLDYTTNDASGCGNGAYSTGPIVLESIVSS